MQQVKTVYNLDGEPRLFYVDEDNDRIEVGSQIELEAAIHSFPNLLVLTVERLTTQEKKEQMCDRERRGRGRGRGGRGCGQGRGWGMWMRGMENMSDEERKQRREMWKQRRIEMLKWKSERLSQKLVFVEEKMKENDGNMKTVWIVEQAVVSANKDFLEKRILELSNTDTNTEIKDDNTNTKWKKMKMRRLQFSLDMIATSLNALQQLSDEHKKSDAVMLRTKKLEMKKAKVEKKIASMEAPNGEEDQPMNGMWGCGFRFRYPHHPHRRHHSHYGPCNSEQAHKF